MGGTFKVMGDNIDIVLSVIENKPLHVVAAVIIRGNEVLACRRAAHKVSAGLWEFPGGKVEAGEASNQALAREILEELGVEISTRFTFDISDTEVGGLTIRLEAIICEIGSQDDLESSDHDSFRWLSATTLGEVTWANPDLPAVALLAEVADFQDLLR